MAIKFAPLNVPLDRRLQTLAAAFWIYSLSFGITICTIVFIYLFFTSYWWLGVLYLTWFYYDRDTPYQGGRSFTWAKALPIWKYFVAYFPIRVVKTAELSPDKNYICCVYPHGILSAGSIGNFATYYTNHRQLFPGLRFYGATLGIQFWAPLFREYILGLGGVSSSKRSLMNFVDPKNKGNALMLIVGGAAEAQYARPGSYRIILKRRKGFIKIALATGASLVPVFSFGEVDIYDQYVFSPSSLLGKFREWLKRVSGVMLCILKGRGMFQYSFGMLPNRAPITSVVGKPIDVPRIENPTDEQVQHYHDLFTKHLQELFEEHKAKYVADPEKTELVIE